MIVNELRVPGEAGGPSEEIPGLTGERSGPPPAAYAPADEGGGERGSVSVEMVK